MLSRLLRRHRSEPLRSRHQARSGLVVLVCTWSAMSPRIARQPARFSSRRFNAASHVLPAVGAATGWLASTASSRSSAARASRTDCSTSVRNSVDGEARACRSRNGAVGGQREIAGPGELGKAKFGQFFPCGIALGRVFPPPAGLGEGPPRALIYLLVLHGRGNDRVRRLFIALLQSLSTRTTMRFARHQRAEFPQSRFGDSRSRPAPEAFRRCSPTVNRVANQHP